MVSDFREIRPQGSPHIPPSPSYGFFAEQARFASYMGPELGRNQLQHFGDDFRQQSPLPVPLPLPLPLPHPHHHHPFPLPQPHNMHEVIQREIEKERIREEIIMSEIVRRRELEAEVRRELMMERELALRRDNNAYPFGSQLIIGFDSAMTLPLLETGVQGRSLEERIVLSLADRERLSGRRENGGFDRLPFQRGSADVRISEGGSGPLPIQRVSADVRISEVKPVSEGAKKKEKIILLAKSNENTVGVKREASAVNASESPSDGKARKKTKEEWSCALCQVNATSEQGLNEHIQGKKHKAREAASLEKKAGKSYSIGLFPKKAAKTTQVQGVVDPGTDSEVKSTSESLPFGKTVEASSKPDDPPLLQGNVNSNNPKKNEESVAAQKVQKSDSPKKKKKYRFWCELCEVGVLSQGVMKKHLNGKKHKRRLNVSGKSCGVGPSAREDGALNEPEEETVAEDGGAVDEMKPDDDLAEVDAADEAQYDDDGAVDVIKPDDDLTEADVVNEPKNDDGVAVNVIKPDDDSTKSDLVNEPPVP